MEPSVMMQEKSMLKIFKTTIVLEQLSLALLLQMWE